MTSSSFEAKKSALPSIKYILDMLSRRLADSKEENHALILIETDNQSISESTLEKMAVELVAACSKKDIVSTFGDDRFAVVTSGFSNTVELEKFISKLLYRISLADNGEDTQVTVRAGAAVNENTSSVQDIVRCAELALIKAKSENNSFSVLSYAEGVQQETEQTAEGRPQRKIQRVLNFAFDAFSKSEDNSTVVKDVIAYISEEYGFIRAFAASLESGLTSAIQWNGNSVAELSDSEISAICARALSGSSPNGVAYEDKRYIIPLKTGIAGAGVLCFEDNPERSKRSDDEISELKTLSKMFSVYKTRLYGSMSAEDELIYYRNALEENSTACLVVDAENYRVLYMNPFAEKVFAGTSVGVCCADNIAQTLERIKNGEEEGCDNRGVYHYDTFDKSIQKWLSSSILCIRRAGGDYAFLITVTDISAHMDNAMTKDKVTGLLTHEGFEIETEKIIYGTDDEYDLAVFKISNFKNINDEFGYQIGDEVLSSVAEKLMLILTENERASRSSGSRFCVLFKRSNFAILRCKLDYLFRIVEDDMSRQHSNLSLTFICGVYPIDRKSFRLSAAMDGANYVIKKATTGKYLSSNVIELYDEEISRSIEERKKVESEMVSSLKNGEFEVVYQPKVSLKTGKVYGAEALIRWNRPDGTIVQPGFFVPIFEDNEFVVEMDNWVYRRVFSQMKQWQDEGIPLPIVSVNVSRLHLKDQSFPEKFEKLVDSYSLPHSVVEIELTESTFVKTYDRLITMMEDIRSRGFKISIDDFGTGYSTLNLISVLPVDVLKLDGNFFMKNKLTDKNKKVIESIIMLAKNLSLTVISEGVETDEQVQFLKEHYCDAVQGYYYYKPMKEEQFKKIISEQ